MKQRVLNALLWAEDRFLDVALAVACVVAAPGYAISLVRRRVLGDPRF